MQDPLNILSLIQAKKRGSALSHGEIQRWMDGITAEDPKDRIPDYQLAALLMAIYFQGMNDEETRDLTLSMAHSGQVLDLSGVGGICVDKHSTGGVGDTTTLVLGPLVAACGGKVAKMSGRGLGHTGGTLDKLDSIPGFKTELALPDFLRQVKEIGCAVVGQSRDLAPADKALYSLRDVTATVDSKPLIVSSIMSKKIAAGSGAIVLDVKTGSGALMHTLEDSIDLAKTMVEVGRLAGKPTLALVTGMDQPLGTHIGNSLEVKEAIDILAGRAKGRLLSVSLSLGAMMLVAGGYAKDEATALHQLQEALAQGRGLTKLREMIEAQGGDGRVTEDVSLLPMAGRFIPVPAPKSGYVNAMDTTALGDASQRLGAGRLQKEDVIDPAVGVVMAVELGDYVEEGQPLAVLHVNKGDPDAAWEIVRNAIRIESIRAEKPPLVYAVVRSGSVERLS